VYSSTAQSSTGATGGLSCTLCAATTACIRPVCPGLCHSCVRHVLLQLAVVNDSQETVATCQHYQLHVHSRQHCKVDVCADQGVHMLPMLLQGHTP
jgi:hypothetical protein